VVVIAVKNAVSAATTTFTATSMILFFIPPLYSLFILHYSLAQRSGVGARFLPRCSLFSQNFFVNLQIIADFLLYLWRYLG
jgi:hypothetical protein